MISKLLPLLLLLIGTAIGTGAGLMTSAPSPAGDGGSGSGEHAGGDAAENTAGAETDYVRLSSQFVIPVVEEGRVASLVVMSLSVETTPQERERVTRMVPKLRDVFLQVLFDHANVGGFSGAFTETEPLRKLRQSLREAARTVLGDAVSDVLIVDIVRQDA